jgi:4-hydroxythreonine-4-phosphate dehydrogenase
MQKKTNAVIQGDPAGIGPELLIKLLKEKETTDRANILVLGDPIVFSRGENIVGYQIENIRHITDITQMDFSHCNINHLDINFEGIDGVPTATVSSVGGASSIGGLHRSLELSQDGHIEGIVFMPFNKESMHLGGNDFNDELGYASQFFKLKTRASEFNIANGMWNGRVTSHVAMKDVPNLLNEDLICEEIALTNQTLELAGYDCPRIVVAAYNPHAGDGGLMGREEIDVIGPAIEKMKEKQISVIGPLPADTLWLKVRDGEYDAVVTMYHDQGQIAIKLLGFDRGVTVLAGLPIPITTPAHGTAFDIAGQNKANIVPSQNAFTMAVNMAEHRKSTDGVISNHNEDQTNG